MMKKIGLALVSIGALVLIILLIVSSNEKSLECKMSNESSGHSQTYILKFDKKDKIKSAKLIQNLKFDGGDLESYKQTIKESINDNEITKDLKAKITDNGKDTVTATVYFKKEDTYKISGGKEAIASYDFAKTALEDGGYTCK